MNNPPSSNDTSRTTSASDTATRKGVNGGTPDAAVNKGVNRLAPEGAATPTRRALEPDSPSGESPPLESETLERLRRDLALWRSGPVQDAQRKVAPRLERYATWSDIEVPDLVTPADVSIDYRADLGLPGQFPFTRGVQPTMYRGRLWTMRMFAGFGTPEQTNERFRYLLAQGQTGLSTAFDFPTLMGYDSDSPRSLGEVGMCGVAVDTLRDMEVLFDGSRSTR